MIFTPPPVSPAAAGIVGAGGLGDVSGHEAGVVSTTVCGGGGAVAGAGATAGGGVFAGVTVSGAAGAGAACAGVVGGHGSAADGCVAGAGVGSGHGSDLGAGCGAGALSHFSGEVNFLVSGGGVSHVPSQSSRRPS